jgi:hypothetical protein
MIQSTFFENDILLVSVVFYTTTKIVSLAKKMRCNEETKEGPPTKFTEEEGRNLRSLEPMLVFILCCICVKFTPQKEKLCTMIKKS